MPYLYCSTRSHTLLIPTCLFLLHLRSLGLTMHSSKRSLLSEASLMLIHAATRSCSPVTNGWGRRVIGPTVFKQLKSTHLALECLQNRTPTPTPWILSPLPNALHLGCVPLKDIKHGPLIELLLIFSSCLRGMNWEQAGYWGCLFPGEEKRALALCLLRAIQLPCRLCLCCFPPTFPEEVFIWPLLSSKQIDANGFGSLMKQTRRNQTSSACYASRRQAENFHRLQKWDISSLTELGEGHLLSRKKNEWAGKKDSWWPFSSLPLCFLGKLRSCPWGREEEA